MIISFFTTLGRVSVAVRLKEKLAVSSLLQKLPRQAAFVSNYLQELQHIVQPVSFISAFEGMFALEHIPQLLRISEELVFLEFDAKHHDA